MPRPPKVLNKQTDRLTARSVIVDRSTPWGNPYQMRGEDTREKVCREFADWLAAWLLHGQEILIAGRSNKWIMQHVGQLKGLDLVCHCAPRKCHADILLMLANGLEPRL